MPYLRYMSQEFMTSDFCINLRLSDSKRDRLYIKIFFFYQDKNHNSSLLQGIALISLSVLR